MMEEWSFPAAMQPDPAEVGFDLGRALCSVVRLRAEVPDEAFTAGTLGTERVGNGVVIDDDGLILTIGYLITEARRVWLTTNQGAVLEAYPLAYDQASGFGLVRALGRLGLPAVARGSAASVATGDEAYAIGHGGRAHALRTRVVARREFAGYWEYLLDDALFTAPAHPEWGGAALLDADGRLVGLGSLLLQERVGERDVQSNMFVPIDLLEPILEPMLTTGVSGRTPRPWLGLYAGESDDGELVVAKVADNGPAARAGLREGDIVRKVGDERVRSLAAFLRAAWRLGPAGVKVPLAISRGGDVLRVELASVDRNDLLHRPRLQ